MSDSYTYKLEGNDHWLKLRAFLQLRSIMEGVWINTPKFWFDAITEENTIINTVLHTDSGGGPLNSFSLKVEEKYSKEVLFSISLDFDEVFSRHSVFVERIKGVYEYMKSYARGDTWFEKTSIVRFEDEIEFDPKKWHELFGPLNRINKIPLKDLKDIERSFPHEGFKLLSQVGDLIQKGDIRLSGESAREAESAREWALMTLLDMERYYYTCC